MHLRVDLNQPRGPSELEHRRDMLVAAMLFVVGTVLLLGAAFALFLSLDCDRICTRSWEAEIALLGVPLLAGGLVSIAGAVYFTMPGISTLSWGQRPVSDPGRRSLQAAAGIAVLLYLAIAFALVLAAWGAVRGDLVAWTAFGVVLAGAWLRATVWIAGRVRRAHWSRQDFRDGRQTTRQWAPLN